MHNRVGCGLVAVVLIGLWLFAMLFMLHSTNRMEKATGYTWHTGYVHSSTVWIHSITASSKGLVFVNADKGVISRSKDGGSHWKNAGKGIKDCFINSIVIDKDEIVYAGSDRGIYRSSDDGDHWTLANIGLPQTSITSLATDRNGQVYAGCDGGDIYKSNDAGAHWIPIRKSRNGKDIYSIGITPTGTIFVGTECGGLLRSIDNGKTWIDLTPRWFNLKWKDPYYELNTIAIDSDKRVYVSADIMYYLNKNGNPKIASFIMRSDDNGDSWTKLYPTDKKTRCNSVAVDNNGRVFAATDHGLFISRDHGEHWSRAGESGGSWFYRLSGVSSRIDAVTTDSKGDVYARGNRNYVFIGTRIN